MRKNSLKEDILMLLHMSEYLYQFALCVRVRGKRNCVITQWKKILLVVDGLVEDDLVTEEYVMAGGRRLYITPKGLESIKGKIVMETLEKGA